MSRPLSTLLCLCGALWALGSTASPAGIPMMRRETSLRYEVDEKFQSAGGVQYFYELAQKEPSPETSSATFRLFRAFDVRGRWVTRADSFYVVMSRLTYTIDKDVSFFTPARANDLTYMNTVAPGLGISRVGADTYRVQATPANTFHLRWLDAAAVRQLPHEPGLSRLLELSAMESLPESVIVQDNTDFARVLGWRTADMSVTWTAHYPLKPGQTRICVFTMSYMVNLPAFFLGGADRVLNESVSGAAQLIRNLRNYPFE